MLFFKNYESELKELALKLFDIEAFKFGDFKMKVNISKNLWPGDVEKFQPATDTMYALTPSRSGSTRRSTSTCE